jgi:ferredoxin-NADP reductase/MOSC domain-containing protein YiiM/predicted pyridoxine 5'-phosphate oxidase superfamily flavin-nucleotide-binding protein
MRPINSSLLDVAARPIDGDPVAGALVNGTEIGTLGIDLESRHRNRLNGKVSGSSPTGFQIEVDQVYPNCPQYIQARRVRAPESASIEPRKVHRAGTLGKEDAVLIASADTFFIASQYLGETGERNKGVDVSHRGGKPGFVIVPHESMLLFPDYSGNCMFNTLGNLLINTRTGLLFVDFNSGDTLQVTGEAQILWEPEHAQRFPGAECVVSFSVKETIRIRQALPLSFEFESYSPVFDKFEPNWKSIESVAKGGPSSSPMKLCSINISMPKKIEHDGKMVTTGIFKEPVDGRVMLRRMNLDGDGQADLWGHGGSFRAVYVYSFENYAYWEQELGLNDFTSGQFGENFTVEGMLEHKVHVGDIFRVGDALVEVSQPRVPCYKLGIKMGIKGFESRFLKSGRIGFYFHVLEEGEVGAGDPIELVKRDPRRMTVRQVSNLLYFEKDDLEAAKEAFSIPALSHGWKDSFEERLAKAEATTDVRKGFRRFVVDRKVLESDTITSFYLVPEDEGALDSFLPGQFLTFELSIAGQPKPVIRTYSLSDSPNSDYYRVSIKREPAPTNKPDAPPGLSSNYFHDHVDVGTEICVKAPRGKFHLDPQSKRPVVLLSGGVGLTPMIAMLNSLTESAPGRNIWFIHGTRNGGEHAMAAHVRRLARENDNVHAYICYSEPRPADVKGKNYDNHGWVEIDLLKKILPFDDFDFYICGPPPFMKSIYRGLCSLNVSEARIHYEFFGPASILRDTSTNKSQARKNQETVDASVTFSRSGVTAKWDTSSSSLLDFAEAQGLQLPFSCRSGICQTCACPLVEGEVEYIEEPLDEPEQGQVLICSSKPLSNIVLDV